MQARYYFGTWMRRSSRPSDIADMMCDVCKDFAFSDPFKPFYSAMSSSLTMSDKQASNTIYVSAALG